MKIPVIILFMVHWFQPVAYTMNPYNPCPLVTTATQVVQTHVIFRHGDRSPDNTYPTDPFCERENWAHGFGELTNTGKQQMYRLGQFMRKRYWNLLTTEYNPREVYAKSSDLDRAIMSAQCVLAGLFPPPKNQVWDSDITNWQPIPVHTLPRHRDKILRKDRPCPKYRKLLYNLLRTPEVKEFERSNSDLYDFIDAHAETKGTTITTIDRFFEIFHIQSLYQFEIPEWAKTVYPEPLTSLYGTQLALCSFTPQMQRLMTGPLLKEIVTHMNDKADGISTSERKMYLYSGHAHTVMGFLRALGITDSFVPPYGFAVMVELRKNASEQYHVEIYYKECDKDVYKMCIPGYCHSIPLETFNEALKAKIPDDWEEECVSFHVSCSSFNNINHCSLICAR